jgi:hypothetical protein
MTAREASISSSVTSLHVSLTSHDRSARSADGCREVPRRRGDDPAPLADVLRPHRHDSEPHAAKTVCEAAVTDCAGGCISATGDHQLRIGPKPGRISFTPSLGSATQKFCRSLIGISASHGSISSAETRTRTYHSRRRSSGMKGCPGQLVLSTA